MKKLVTMLLVLAMVLTSFACATEPKDSSIVPGDSSSSSDASSVEEPVKPTIDLSIDPQEVLSDTYNPGAELAPVDASKIEADSGDYVYKDAVSTFPTNWNPHTYQTTDDAYPAAFLRTGLYDFFFNDEIHPVTGKDPYTGYRIVPEMASAFPVDVTETIRTSHPEFKIPASAKKGYAYTIDLNKNAKWENGTLINADTYVASMQRLLNPLYLNYRATDYYANSLSIAGAENYANSGKSVKRINSTDGENTNFAFADFVKGADGKYTTADGNKLYFGLDTDYAWMSGHSLEDYKSYMGEVMTTLRALADKDGYVPVTDDSINALYTFTGSDTWGNESKDTLAYYVSYDYTYPVTEYSSVGLYKSGEYQITLVLTKSLTGFNLLYNLTSNWIVEPNLYDANIKQSGDAYLSTYNTNAETTLSYGPYKMTYYQADKSMVYEKNTNWYGYSDGIHVYKSPNNGKYYNMYQTSKITTEKIAEAKTRKINFLSGQLMTYGLQAEDFEEYRGSDYSYVTPSETIFFLIFNGNMEAIKGRESAEGFDKAAKDLETMTLTEFRQAFAVTYDKEAFASTISPSRSGGYGLIGNSYIYDPESGAKYRDSDQAKRVLCNFYGVDVSKYEDLDDAVDSITGYDPVLAKKLFTEAYKKAIEKGYITDTNADGKCDQSIEMEYCISTDSEFMTKTINYLNSELAKVIAGTPFEGKISVIKSAAYGNKWSDMTKSGMSDLVLGGWSGSALDPFGITDLYVNPSYQYDASWFNAESVVLNVEVSGKVVKFNLKQLSDALNGAVVTINGTDYNFGSGIVDNDTRLSILACLEENILGTFDYIPTLQDAGMALLSKQVYYVIKDYNPVMGRGGIAYMRYNYNESDWATYVSNNLKDGKLDY